MQLAERIKQEMAWLKHFAKECAPIIGIAALQYGILSYGMEEAKRVGSRHSVSPLNQSMVFLDKSHGVGMYRFMDADKDCVPDEAHDFIPFVRRPTLILPVTREQNPALYARADRVYRQVCE